MKFNRLICHAAIAVATLTAQSAVLTNEIVCEMVRTGSSEDAMIAAIENGETDFVLDSEHLIGLHSQNVPRSVIRAMLRKGSGRAGVPKTLAPVPEAVPRNDVVAQHASGAEVVLQRRVQNATFVKSDKTDARAVIANLLLSDVGISLLTAGLSQQMKMWNPYMGDTLARATQLGRGLLAGSKAETRGFEYETLPGVAATATVHPGKLSIAIPAHSIPNVQQAVIPVLLKLEAREKDGARILASRQVVIRQIKQGRFDMSPTVERQEVAVQEATVAVDVERLPDGNLRVQTKEHLAPGEYALVLRLPGHSGAPTSNVALPVSTAEVASLFSAFAGQSRMSGLGGFGRMLGGKPPNTGDEMRNTPSSAFIAWDFRVVQ
jgi:hypothetical protein